eukprot:8098345-Alexandrium_andersonii.AAC.1
MRGRILPRSQRRRGARVQPSNGQLPGGRDMREKSARPSIDMRKGTSINQCPTQSAPRRAKRHGIAALGHRGKRGRPRGSMGQMAATKTSTAMPERRSTRPGCRAAPRRRSTLLLVAMEAQT